MINKNIFGFVVVAALGFALVGCGSSNPDADTIDEIFGGNEVNDCDAARAVDRRGETAVTITAISAWDDPHGACIVVSPGTEVTWKGNFDDHPLVGGESPATDPGSPITQAGSTSGTADATITFSATGLFPYFCDLHRMTMLGVVAVAE
jgi:plastocyanin